MGELQLFFVYKHFIQSVLFAKIVSPDGKLEQLSKSLPIMVTAFAAQMLEFLVKKKFKIRFTEVTNIFVKTEA